MLSFESLHWVLPHPLRHLLCILNTLQTSLEIMTEPLRKINDKMNRPHIVCWGSLSKFSSIKINVKHLTVTQVYHVTGGLMKVKRILRHG